MRGMQQVEPWRLDGRRDDDVAAGNVTHPARPQKHIDLDKLRQDIMARFRETLAYLAR